MVNKKVGSQDLDMHNSVTGSVPTTDLPTKNDEARTRLEEANDKKINVEKANDKKTTKTNKSNIVNDLAIAARNEVLMEEAIKKTHEKALALRPINTNKAYAKKQQEFIDWCEEKQFSELCRSTVSGSKLHWFLVEQVVDRKRKVKRKDDTGDEVIGNHTLKQYANAVVDLWKRQKTSGANSNEQPRNEAVQQLLKNHATDTANRKRANYDDRAIGSLLDGYCDINTLIRIVNGFWEQNNGAGLRDRAAFLLCQSLFLRGENVRNMELPDMFSLVLENESPSQTCFALVAILDRGKTNSFGKLYYAACIRHDQVEACTIGAVAFHFFFRFMIHGEPFPNMSDSSLWYDTKFMNSSKSTTEPITPSAHEKPISKIFKKLNLPFNKKTHVGRSSGARMADLAGASVDSIRRQGRWNATTLDSSYLLNLPREILRTSAGFPLSQGSYYIKRDLIQPPQSLLSQIFPEADHWHNYQQTCAHPNLAAGGFLNLIMFLRRVVLQDAVQLLNMGKTHTILEHQIFKSPEFLRYRADLTNAMNNAEVEPQELLIRRAYPLLAERLFSLENRLLGSVESLKIQLDRSDQKLDNLSNNVILLYNSSHNSANMDTTIQKCVTNIAKKIFEKLYAGVTDENSIIDVQDEHPIKPSTPMNTENQITATTPIEDENDSDSDAVQYVNLESRDNKKTNMFTLCRGITDCVNFWKEWSIGVMGKPPICELETKFGAKWRNANDSKMLSRRRAIIDEIELMASEQKITPDIAAQHLEKRRIALGNLSLQKFALHLKSSRNQGNKSREKPVSLKKQKHKAELKEQSNSAENAFLPLANLQSGMTLPMPNNQMEAIYMGLDDKYPQNWIQLKLYEDFDFHISFQDTLANGLCFFYSLRRFGIENPRERLIEAILDPSPSEYVQWLLRACNPDRSKNDLVAALQVPPQNRDAWADDWIMLLSAIVFKVRILMLQQKQVQLLLMHSAFLTCFPDFEFENTVYIYHHYSGTILSDGTNDYETLAEIEKRLTEAEKRMLRGNHYGILRFTNLRGKPIELTDDMLQHFNSLAPKTSEQMKTNSRAIPLVIKEE
jgi:hypothetical protein